MKRTSAEWFSNRIDGQMTLTRWGHWGQPVLIFPTAGGDSEEIERMQMIAAIAPLIEAGRIKVYSCDSVSGRALVEKQGSVAHRCWVLNGFEEAVAAEVIPAIHKDCGGHPIDVIAAGASIGAFHAAAVTCRYPHLFKAAIGMSGTYDLERLFGIQGNEHYFYSSPLAFVPGLGGDELDRLRQRFILMAYGEGRWENPAEAWGMERMLGAKGIPNRVDVWGKEWDHDWVTWRDMLPKYLNELVPE